MAEKNLVIVESPTKAKTIGKILGKQYTIIPSMGHLIDLPEKKLGVEIEEGFKPEYVVIPGRQKVLAALKKEAKTKPIKISIKRKMSGRKNDKNSSKISLLISTKIPIIRSTT